MDETPLHTDPASDELESWLTELPPRATVPASTPLPLARRLADAGLPWTPREGDRFVIPDRGMDDRSFLVAPMVVEVTSRSGDRLIAFNGTTEWALDHVLTSEAVWLPSETDLRVALGEGFIGLWRHADGWVVEHTLADGARTVEAGSAVEALALAMLAVLDAG